MDLVNETGFDPVDAGPLDESWRQQPGTPAYCCDYDAETTRKGLAAAVKGEAPKNVEHSIRLLRQHGMNMTPYGYGRDEPRAEPARLKSENSDRDLGPARCAGSNRGFRPSLGLRRPRPAPCGSPGVSSRP
jgi:hypothetical protein